MKRRRQKGENEMKATGLKEQQYLWSFLGPGRPIKNILFVFWKFLPNFWYRDNHNDAVIDENVHADFFVVLPARIFD